MAPGNTRSEYARVLARLLAAGLMLACATTERTFNENTSPSLGGSAAAVGGAATGVVQSSAGSSSVGGTKASGGGSAVGGAPNVGGQSSSGNSSVGGSTTTLVGSGGAAIVGGAPAMGGQSSAGTSSVGTTTNGGVSASGGSPVAGGASVAGGTSSLGTSSVAGTSSTGGSLASGGATTQGGSQSAVDTSLGGAGAIGGVAAMGGTNASGGAVGTGGTSTCTPTTEICTDGIDNDCNGTIDCPIIAARFPEPGRAAAGDDASVQLNAPVLAIQEVQCRTGKPSLIVSKPWTACTSSAPTSLTVYSMSLAEANLDENNGVTQFDFRFLYTSGAVSDPRSIVYYAHNSLADTVAGTPGLVCPALASDAAYFSLASSYLTGADPQPTFAPNDVQLKNPFVALTFSPSQVSSGPGVFAKNTVPQPISVLSLRHRFLLDPTRQMLLVTRSYKARRETGQTCRAAIIAVRDTYTNKLYNPRSFKNNHCDAIVLNKAGSGVCIEVVGGTPTIRGIHSTATQKLLEGLGIPWPNVDMAMWQKLFDDRRKRNTLQLFSDKCRAEDTACFALHTAAGQSHALSLPDSNDPYFTSP